MTTFDQLASPHHEHLLRTSINSVQVNVGKLCNQSCSHCHVEAGPRRKESMDWLTFQRIVEVLPKLGAQTVDITGGAPELNPHFKHFVEALHEHGYGIIVRCNLTILNEPGMEDLPEFYMTNGVHIIASLPCYTESVTDGQRGKGVFEKSIDALRRLNQVGYGTALPLDLVYNPAGAFLPPPQAELEHQYRTQLSNDYEVQFSHLFTITNIPIGRFAQTVKSTYNHNDYIALLRSRFNPNAVPELMCRKSINIGWDGKVYDCDFNAMEERPILHKGVPLSVWELEVETILSTAISTADYCFACTAGCGSSCTGTLTDYETTV